MLSTITVNGVTWKYEYDDNGNITKIYKNNVLDKEYTYDVLNQLTKEVDKATGTTTTYTYDKQGNLTSAGNHTYTYGDSKGWSDLLTTYDGSGIAYDNIGNPTIYRDFSMTWQNGRELASLTKNSKTFTYAYNDSGIRTSKTVNGHTNAIYLSGDAIVRENPTGNISLTYLYDESGTRYGFLYKNGSTSSYYYYVYNGQGDVTEIVDSSGNKVAQYAYNAWGLPLSVKDGSGNTVTSATHIANLNPFRYRGYYYDTESGFYYLQSRYYDPETCRFINADAYVSTGQGALGTNMFAYCGNNPVNRVDYSGNKPGDLFDTIDEAALDFAMCYNALSIAEKKEYGSAIYQVEETKTIYTILHIVVHSLFFSLTLPLIMPIDITTCHYSYTEPFVGKTSSSVIPNFLTSNPIVSTVHTHGNYDAKYDNENFSTGFASDIGWSDFFRMKCYVATPGGYLKKYTFKNRSDANGGITIISSSIPWDPNSPDHK